MKLRKLFSHKTHFSVEFISLGSKTFKILFLIPNFYLRLFNFANIVAEGKKARVRFAGDKNAIKMTQTQ